MFKARYLLPDHKPPGRIYISAGGLEEAFGKNFLEDKTIENAIKFGVKTIDENKGMLNRFDFFIGIVSSDLARREKIFTLFTYDNANNWKGNNPRIKRSIFKSGFLVTEKIDHIDEDTIIVLGKEGMFRKTTGNLEDYMRRYPHLGRLEPKRGYEELHV